VFDKESGVYEMNLVTTGYFISAALFVMLELLLITHWRGRRQGGLLLLVVASIIAWAFASGMAGYHERFFFRSIIFFEVLRNILLYTFLFGLLGSAYQSRQYGFIYRIFHKLIYAVSLVILAATFYINYNLKIDEYTFHIDYRLVLGSVLLMSCIGLILLAELFRKVNPAEREMLKFMFFAIGLIFMSDFLLYSNALLFGHIDKGLWSGRGYLIAIAVPMLTLSAQRNPNWSIDVFISKQLVLHATTLVGIGIYVFLVAIVIYFIDIYGGSRGALIQVAFISLAVLLLLFVLFSSTLRARTKVFINKHFFNYKYDYREEWANITRQLSKANEENSLYITVINSIASLVMSKAGMLWLQNDNNTGYHVVAHTFSTEVTDSEPVDGDFAKYLQDKDWIIDLAELQHHPERYQELVIPQWLLDLQDAWLVIPLRHRDELYGFLILSRSITIRSLNWEDRDLLKTAAMQAVSYLVFQQASDSLARSEKFAVFHRLSAFIVHDLKNLIAQLDLITRNAEKFKHNPDFVDDAFETVQYASNKMGRLLTQLKQGRFSAQAAGNINIQDAMEEVVRSHITYLPYPQLQCSLKNVRISANHDRFLSVLGHIIKNAQEATEDEGYVRINVSCENEMVVIKVADDGCGMDESFIKEKLFTPFFTTKGNAGMGVGVYECREFIESLGGHVEVNSTPGKGTEFILKIPTVTDHEEQIEA
jgi:putative PEP-CTERM system histidine kinase